MESSDFFIAPVTVKLPAKKNGEIPTCQMVPLTKLVPAKAAQPGFRSVLPKSPDHLRDIVDGCAFKDNQFLNPLTTKAKSYSDLPENFTTDSPNFLKNKMFLHEFFSSRGYQDIRNFRFFLFLTVRTYVSSKIFECF